MIERYTVYWVDLNPVVGSELAKTRPAVVISDDAMNRHLETVVVCPITSTLHPRWPSRVQTELDHRACEIAVDQIRTISRRRIGARIATIGSDVAETVRHVITQMYGVLSIDSPGEPEENTTGKAGDVLS